MCVSVPLTKLHEHACPYCFSCGTEVCLQTNYGDVVVKFIAVPSFMRQCLLHKHASFDILRCGICWTTGAIPIYPVQQYWVMDSWFVPLFTHCGFREMAMSEDE